MQIRVSILYVFGPPWKRSLNFALRAQTTEDAQSMNIYLFQGAAFLGTGKGGSSTSTAEYRTSGMLFSPGNGPE